ncbi:hypothetical protein VDBG_02007 [Verticillium alfalfae VaMs.102]|uniref:Uncharacterized protein n=1 Tax=Verticillium alfalfae (strain VaMs.102 / ATCC MYA-4576 / FGSC 10136) TaxID=526221 RepID=C9SC14_VERA1|nr:hypothetical protein VDBG_02007 [Verticillium alfalfae VaMs.102]EEY15898.1 hypothetical protein VDBG_02007 [Verticillium alfalfae VaMs.102]
MRLTVAALLATAASLASGAVVITPVTQNQVVDRVSGDCYFGVATPQGCAPLRK